MKYLLSILGLNEQSLFASFLEFLGIKYNKFFADNYYNGHPYKNCLYGLYAMLEDYGVESIGLKIEDKEEIVSLEVPFIAQVADDFVIVSKITSDTIEYIWRGKKITSQLNNFLDIWTGVVLIAQTNEKSGEPEFEKHHKEEIFKRILSFSFLVCVLILSIVLYATKGSYTSLQFNSLLLVHILGIYISSLLILKQVHVRSNYADKLCSLFHKAGCDNILETLVAKLGGLISWSEIGLSYFVGNLIIILCVPAFIEYLVFLNLIVLPYSLWSIWYQRFRAKQWCVLCLLVQGILWLIAVINLVFGTIQLPQLTSIDIVYVVCIYLLPYLVISLFLPIIFDAKQRIRGVQQLNRIKMRKEVFYVLLKAQPYYNVDSATSQIIFGNPEAELLITILSNPHCSPCAGMHKRVEKLLGNCGNKLCVQYIFSSFEKEYDNSLFFLLAVYLNNNNEYIRNVYNRWFEGGASHREEFFAQYSQNTSEEEIQEEFWRHKDWIKETKLYVSPTILINGYLLPKEYEIEDMKYFIDTN